MFIESLDARRLYTSTGLDPTFAAAGRLSLDKRFVPGDAITAVGRKVFVGVAKDGLPYPDAASPYDPFTGTPYVAEVNDRGQIERSFGDNGYAKVPYEVTGIAVGYHGNYLYVVGQSNGATYRDKILHVTRLRPNGVIDTGFGFNGTFSYAPPTPAGDDSYAVASVQKMTPLRDGSVLLGIERTTSAGDLSGQSADFNVALMKVRDNGTRDPKFGKSGVVQLLGGTLFRDGSGGGNDYIYRARVKGAFFNDMQTDASGNTRVLMRYEDGQRLDSQFDNAFGTEADTGSFYLKSRTITATGAEVANEAYSWLIGSAADQRRQRSVQK